MLFGPIEAPKSDLHVSRLSAVYKTGTRIPDTDHATWMNIDAWEQINLDASFAHGIGYHRKLISGTTWRLKAASSEENDRQVTGIIQEQIEGIRDFAKARYSLSEVVFRGSSFLYIRGHRKVLKLGGFPMQEWWVPYKLQHVDKWRVRKTYDVKSKRLVYWMYSLGDEKWKVIDKRALVTCTNTDEESFLTHGNGLMNPLWHSFFAKKCVEEKALRYLERFAEGTLEMSIEHKRETSDARSPQKVAEDYLDMVRNLSSDKAYTKDKLDDFKVIEPTGQGWQVIEFLLNYFGNEGRLLSIGANLPVAATDGGSFALGAIQENSVMFNARYGRQLIENAMTDDLIALLLIINRRQFAACGLKIEKGPKFLLPEERTLSPEMEMNIAKGMKEMGAPLVLSELYERIGWTEPIKGVHKVTNPTAGEQAPGGNSFSPLGPGEDHSEPKMPRPTDTEVKDESDAA